MRSPSLAPALIRRMWGCHASTTSQHFSSDGCSALIRAAFNISISTTTLTSSPSGSTAGNQKRGGCSFTGSLTKPSPSGRPHTTPSSANPLSTGSERDTPFKELLNSGALQLSLFDHRDMASITSPDFPGERLVVCRNPDLAAERTRKREELLVATEKDLARIKAAVARKRDPLRGTAAIALAVGEVLNTHKIRKHFDLDITDAAFSFARKTAEIAAEAATDGLYVVRTNLSAATLDDADTVRSYKSLSLVERAFRCIKTVDLNVRPVYHWLADRVRAHVFLCMLAYYLEWH